jgi:NAD(P)-dependent dehydrogenase (short-subunit alcohol dehydrogenase family)
MRKQGWGLIIYTGSIMGRTVVPFSGPYTATKFATEAMAESLLYELHGSGVDVTILQAGGFPTEILDKIESAGDPDRVDSMQALKERSDGLWQQWFTMLETAAPSPDLVADAMVNLVEAAPGQRPLRVVVDPVTGGDATEAVNRTCTDVQKDLLTGIGFADVLPTPMP